MDTNKLFGIGVIIGATTAICSGIGYCLTRNKITHLQPVNKNESFNIENDEVVFETDDDLYDIK